MAETAPKGKPTPKQKSVTDKLAGAKLAEKSVELCLRGDLQADFEDVERRLLQTRQDGSDQRLTSGAEARQLAEQLEALREEMSESMMTVRFRALSKPKWTALMKAHPSDDPKQAFNAESLVAALLMMSVVEVDGEERNFTDEEWVQLLGDAEHDGALSSAQYDLLQDTAWNLNRKDAQVPFSRLGSALLRNSEPTLKQPTVSV